MRHRRHQSVLHLGSNARRMLTELSLVLFALTLVVLGHIAQCGANLALTGRVESDLTLHRDRHGAAILRTNAQPLGQETTGALATLPQVLRIDFHVLWQHVSTQRASDDSDSMGGTLFACEGHGGTNTVSLKITHGNVFAGTFTMRLKVD